VGAWSHFTGDDAIARLEASGELQRLIARQRLPAMLGPILDRPWFMLLDIVGTVAFALSGLLIAVRERYSVLGALVLASLPAVGGGVLRDLLVGREPIAILASPLPLLLVFGTVLGGFVVVRSAAILRRSRLGGRVADRVAAHPVGRQLYEFCDAIGLAAFTVTGVAVAISTYAQPLWIWGPLLAGLTAAGGGILRDLVRQAGGIASLKTSFYGEVPLLWGLLLSVYLLWEGTDLDHREFAVAIVVTVVGALATRIAVVVRGVRPPGFAA
jgi:polar amino acid transport system substrate-binding protein